MTKKTVIFSIIATVLFATVVYAGFLRTEISNIDVRLGGFETEIAGLTKSSGIGQVDPSSGIITLTQNEYETNFALSVKYRGRGKQYIRAKIIESWYNIDAEGNETIIISGPSNYTLESNVSDNRSVDGYLYIKQPVSGEDNEAYRTLDVVKGGRFVPDYSIAQPQATHVKIAVQLEAVQFNRYQAVWGISTIPMS